MEKNDYLRIKLQTNEAFYTHRVKTNVEQFYFSCV